MSRPLIGSPPVSPPVAGGVLVLFFLVTAGAADPDLAPPKSVKQGDAFAVKIPESVITGVARSDGLIARFSGREWQGFSTLDGTAILMGVDMDAEPGAQEYVIERNGPQGAAIVARGAVIVKKTAFASQSLSLPDSQVDLDPDTLRRVEMEQSAMLAAMQPVTPRLWEGDFVMPTAGDVQHTFGRRRVINGQPRNPHTGEDISAPAGAPVAAINHGTVRLVADQFFSGKSVVIDHGLGLYSMYFHLSEVSVRVGDVVVKSQLIGAVGATGRASGPHLHWGVRLNGARVNPLSLNTALTSLITAAH